MSKHNILLIYLKKLEICNMLFGFWASEPFYEVFGKMRRNKKITYIYRSLITDKIQKLIKLKNGDKNAN